MDRTLVALRFLSPVVLAAFLGAGLPLAGASGAAADPVGGSVDEGIESIGTGSHRITLPASDVTTLRLHRSARVSTFHLALWFIGSGDSIGEGASLSIGTAPDDTDCGSASIFRPTVGEPAPLLFASTSTWTDHAEHPCATSTELFVTIPPPRDPSDAGREATLLVYEEPPLSAASLDLLNEPATPTWTAPVATTPRPIDAGRNPADAPVLTPGTFKLAVEPGSTAVVGVPLGWDQSLRARVDGSTAATIEVLGPMLGRDVSSSGVDERGAWAQTWVESYLQRNSLDPTRAGAVLAGVHYVLVSLPADAPPPADPLTLTIAVDGASGNGIPDYVLTDGTVAPQAGSRLVDGTLPAPQATSSDAVDSDTSEATSDEWRHAAVIAGAAVVLCCAVALVVRRRRRRYRPTRRASRGRGQ